MKSFTCILLLIVLQGVFVKTAFKEIIIRPDEYVFTNQYDGIKNYFTLYSYVNDTVGGSYSHYRMMNFPFGDVVIYTDNTPAFAVPLKLLSGCYPLLKSKVISVFDMIILLNLITCSIFCFLILRKLVSSYTLALIVALTLPWINPMFFRMGYHLNLSLSTVITFWLWLLLEIYEKRFVYKKFILLNTILATSIALSFLIHPYYAFIGSFLSGFFLLTLACATRITRALVFAFITPGTALLSAKVFLTLLDPFASQRSSAVIGNGFDDWEVTLASMFTPNSFNSVRFFGPESFYPFHHETKAYVGTAIILALAFILCCIFLWRKESSFLWSKLRTIPAIVPIFLVTALLMIMLSFGEDFYILGTKHHFYNFLNPIYILRKTVLPELAHIRYVSRFYFPVIFILYFILAWFIDRLFKSGKTIFKVAAITFLLAVIIDFYDSILASPKGVHNPFSATAFDNLEGKDVPFRNCEAILPIPYYYAGSEDLEHTIETDEAFFNYTLQLSALTGLPLMSCKMSRTPEYQNHLQLDLFQNYKPSPQIAAVLKGKNILVVYHKYLNQKNVSTAAEGSPVAKQVIQNGVELPSKLNMEKISETGNLIFYKWVVS